jgi:glycosyltransferase involved in cell wall biosynthesis
VDAVNVVHQKTAAFDVPRHAQGPDGITVLGVQFASIASLFAPLQERAGLSLVHVNDWLNVWRGRWRADRTIHVEPPADVDWQDWRLPPGWTNRFARWVMPILVKRIRQTWQRQGWRNPRLVVTFPYLLPIAQEVGLERTIYYAVDNYQSFWPDRADALAAQEDDLIRRAAATVAAGALLTDWFKERVPQSRHKIHQIPNGVSPAMVRPPAAAVLGAAPLQQRFAEHFAGRTGPIVGHYATIEPQYGIDLLLAAAERLPDFRFLVMGQVLPGPPLYSQALAKLAKLPNVLMAGRLQEPHSRELLWQCDLMVIPVPLTAQSRYSCPNRLWTFMATGRPIVSTPIPEVAKFGDLVYLGESVDDFVGALRVAEKERDQARTAARIEIARRHTWPALADKMWSVLSL